jgi:hypothetical protein
MVDGKRAGEGKLARTLAFRMSLDEMLDCGEDTGMPVSEDYHVPFKFTGKINKLTLKVDRPQLSPEDIKKIEAAQRNNKASE